MKKEKGIQKRLKGENKREKRGMVLREERRERERRDRVVRV